MIHPVIDSGNKKFPFFNSSFEEKCLNLTDFSYF